MTENTSDILNDACGELKVFGDRTRVAKTCNQTVWQRHFPTFEDAVYFSTVTYSTLGYGDIVIEGQWRMLSACQAMTGLSVFGWSTALLFAVVERDWSRNFGEPEDS